MAVLGRANIRITLISKPGRELLQLRQAIYTQVCGNIAKSKDILHYDIISN